MRVCVVCVCESISHDIVCMCRRRSLKRRKMILSRKKRKNQRWKKPKRLQIRYAAVARVTVHMVFAIACPSQQVKEQIC